MHNEIPEEIAILGNKICDFMEAQYGSLSESVVFNIYWALGTGHYIWKEDKFFACYWCVRPEDVEGVRERIKPLDITHGSVMYVAEAASTVGLGEVIKALRKQAVGMKGLFWHRPAKLDKVYSFPSQKGAINGIERKH
jgi:hypothetical protein